MKRICNLVLWAAPLFLFAEEVAEPIVQKPFFEAYCTKCHGEEKQKGEIRLDDRDAITTDEWQWIYEQMVNGEMPPEDELQPSQAERAGVIDFILGMGSVESEISSTGFRRLNKREYENTVRDLLGIVDGIYNPASTIYDDDIAHGFDTNAESLIISNELLLEYLGAGEKSLRLALFSAEKDAPPTRRIEVPMKQMKGTGGRRYSKSTDDYSLLRVGGSGRMYDGSETKVMQAPGIYRITVTAEGAERGNYSKTLRPAEGPIKMGIGIIGAGEQNLTNKGKLQKVFDLKDDQPQTFEFETWIDEGYFPYISFVNGLTKPVVQIRAAVRNKEIKESELPGFYNGPGVKVTKYVVEGPFNREWPPETFKITYGTNGVPDLADKYLREQLIRRFMSRAFRRPVAADEMTPYLRYLDQQHAATADWHESMIRTYAAIMGSVDFLYRREGGGRLDSFALINRLSFFFWSTMPDPELFRLANTGEIQDPIILKRQVLRLLEDPRATRFSHSFADQWLSLDKLGTMPPDAKAKNFRIYYRANLESAMLEETRLYFEYIMRYNQPVRDFLDSDYSFLNPALADLYEISHPTGSGFTRVELPEGAMRGGLLGHASILTLSANGVETSPIERGHWVLDELLGTPPPPAPEEVAALVPDLNGITTVREQLERHRADPACMECHRRMDPPGFALESFDPIGRFRTKYDNRRIVETDSAFLGREFQDVEGFKEILLTQLEPFTRNLIIKIAEYAKGRELEIPDLKLIESVLKKTAYEDHRLKDIIIELATSELMTHR